MFSSKRQVLSAAVIVAGLSSFAWATIRIVPNQYQTIQQAIDASQNGDDVMVVAPFESSERITINKSIELRSYTLSESGYSGVWLYAPAQITTSTVIINQINFYCSGDDGDYACIHIANGCNNIFVFRCQIYGENNKFSGIYNDRGGINNLYVSECEFVNCKQNLFLQNMTNSNITYNTISGTECPIVCSWTTTNQPNNYAWNYIWCNYMPTGPYGNISLWSDYSNCYSYYSVYNNSFSGTQTIFNPIYVDNYVSGTFALSTNRFYTCPSTAWNCPSMAHFLNWGNNYFSSCPAGCWQ